MVEGKDFISARKKRLEGEKKEKKNQNRRKVNTTYATRPDHHHIQTPLDTSNSLPSPPDATVSKHSTKSYIYAPNKPPGPISPTLIRPENPSN